MSDADRRAGRLGHRDRSPPPGSRTPRTARGTGPGVVVVHEIPGITPAVAAFADEVVAAGFTVVMPSLVGTPGKEPSGAVRRPVDGCRLCIAREFTTWAMNRTSPVIGWLRALARNLHADVGGPGVGAVGMCFTGGFALGMMVDDIMLAPVLQPAVAAVRRRHGPRRPTSACRPTTPRPWPSGPRRAARCSACGSPATGWSATASPRCATCSATRSSPSSSPARKPSTTRCSPSSATRRASRASSSSSGRSSSA